MPADGIDHCRSRVILTLAQALERRDWARAREAQRSLRRLLTDGDLDSAASGRLEALEALAGLSEGVERVLSAADCESEAERLRAFAPLLRHLALRAQPAPAR